MTWPRTQSLYILLRYGLDHSGYPTHLLAVLNDSRSAHLTFTLASLSHSKTMLRTLRTANFRSLGSTSSAYVQPRHDYLFLGPTAIQTYINVMVFYAASVAI